MSEIELVEGEKYLVVTDIDNEKWQVAKWDKSAGFFSAGTYFFELMDDTKYIPLELAIRAPELQKHSELLEEQLTDVRHFYKKLQAENERLRAALVNMPDVISVAALFSSKREMLDKLQEWQLEILDLLQSTPPRQPYTAPAITHELDLETKAGSPSPKDGLGIPGLEFDDER